MLGDGPSTAVASKVTGGTEPAATRTTCAPAVVPRVQLTWNRPFDPVVPLGALTPPPPWVTSKLTATFGTGFPFASLVWITSTLGSCWPTVSVCASPDT